MRINLAIDREFCPPQPRPVINPSLVWWGTPGNCLNHDEILEHPGGIKIQLKHWNISRLSQNYPLEE